MLKVHTVGLSADLENARFCPTMDTAEPNTIIEFDKTGHIRVADEDGKVWFRKVARLNGMSAIMSPILAKHPELKRAESVKTS